MTLALLLLLLSVQSPTHAPSTADITVSVEKQSVVVTVYPRGQLEVKSVRVQPHSVTPNAQVSPVPLGPRSSERLSERGVKATFDHPQVSFHIVVTLGDNSVHLLDEWGRRISTGPRIVEATRLSPLGTKSH